MRSRSSARRPTGDVPVARKTAVNGDERAPLYTELTKAVDSDGAPAVQGNFEKFLVAPDGAVVNRFRPRTEQTRPRSSAPSRPCCLDKRRPLKSGTTLGPVIRVARKTRPAPAQHRHRQLATALLTTLQGGPAARQDSSRRRTPRTGLHRDRSHRIVRYRNDVTNPMMGSRVKSRSSSPLFSGPVRRRA